MEKIIYAVNSILAVLIIRFESNSDSDKTIIITSVLYILLVVINLIFGIFSQMDKVKYYKHFYYSSLLLIVGVFLFGLLS